MKLKKVAAYALGALGLLMVLSSFVLLYVRLWLSEDGRIIPTVFLNFLFGLCMWGTACIWTDEIEKQERRRRL